MLLQRKVPPNFFCIFFPFILSFCILIATDFSVIINSKQGVPNKEELKNLQGFPPWLRIPRARTTFPSLRSPRSPLLHARDGPAAASPFSSSLLFRRRFLSGLLHSPPLGAVEYLRTRHTPTRCSTSGCKTKGSLSGCSLLARPHPGPYASRLTSAMAQHTTEAEESRA